MRYIDIDRTQARGTELAEARECDCMAYVYNKVNAPRIVEQRHWLQFDFRRLYVRWLYHMLRSNVWC